MPGASCRVLVWLLAASLNVAMTTGCSGFESEVPRIAPSPQGPVLQPGAPGEPNATVTGSAATPVITPTPAYSADVTFYQDMIVHHAQAIVMVELVRANLTDGVVIKLADRIAAEQKPEIDAMASWLKDKGQSVPPQAENPRLVSEHHSAMNGMATQTELTQLGQARGVAADRLFMTLMIRHHQGALEMVGKHAVDGVDPDVERMAADINVTQAKQIAQMQQLLDRLS